jgi:hypothetical protein
MTDDKEVRYKQKRKNNQELFYITDLPLIQMKNATMICDDDDDDDDETFTAEDSKNPTLFSLLSPRFSSPFYANIPVFFPVGFRRTNLLS